MVVPVDFFDVVLGELVPVEGALPLPGFQVDGDAVRAEHVTAREHELLPVLLANRTQHVRLQRLVLLPNKSITFRTLTCSSRRPC